MKESDTILAVASVITNVNAVASVADAESRARTAYLSKLNTSQAASMFMAQSSPFSIITFPRDSNPGTIQAVVALRSGSWLNNGIGNV
jgi:hypothetical protein